MMLAEAPSGLITVVSTPPAPGALVVPENRVTTASPGCSGPCCAKAADDASCRDATSAAKTAGRRAQRALNGVVRAAFIIKSSGRTKGLPA